MRSDTAVALIPVSLLRMANAKMVERLYLLEINRQQDSLIMSKDAYIREQQSAVMDLQGRITEAKHLNKSISRELEKQKKKNRIIKYGAGSVVVGLVAALIFK